MQNTDRVRYSVYMEKSLAEYLEKEVERLGISKSGYFSTLVSNDKLQKDIITLSSGLSQIAGKLIELEKKLDK